MSQIKISQLPSLSGVNASGQIPVSQDGKTSKVSFDDFKGSLGFDDVVHKSDEGYTVVVANTLKSFDANTATVSDLYDITATLLQTLKTKGVI